MFYHKIGLTRNFASLPVNSFLIMITSFVNGLHRLAKNTCNTTIPGNNAAKENPNKNKKNSNVYT